MNKDHEQRNLGQELRAIALRELVAQFPIGIYGYSKFAARVDARERARWRADHPDERYHGYFSRLIFRLAGAISKNEPLPIDERIFLSRLLHALSEGFDVRVPLRIDARKVGHKPSEAILNAAIVRELEQRIADGQRTSDRNPNAKAYEDVARITGKSSGDAVRQIWNRRAGQ